MMVRKAHAYSLAHVFLVLERPVRFGAPIVGWVANHFGPRWSMGLGAPSGPLPRLWQFGFFCNERSLCLQLP